MSEREVFLQRLDAVESRLAAVAAAPAATGALTAADSQTGERWEAGQVWAHLAEFVPYWIGQARSVIDRFQGDAVAFGRTKSDPDRIGAIERDRSLPIAVLWSDTHADLESLRLFLTHMDSRAWAARGLHPTLGVLSMERLVGEFLVGHLEEHAAQLEELAR